MSTQVKKQHRMLKISILRYNPADPAERAAHADV